MRGNPITGVDPSGQFAFFDTLVTSSVQTQLIGLYADPAVSLVDSLKGIAFLANERNAVLDNLLGTESQAFDFSGIDRGLNIYQGFQTATLGLFGAGAGFKFLKAGGKFFLRILRRAGGRRGLLTTLDRGTRGLRGLFRFGRRGASSIGVSASDLSRLARATDRGGLTAAGRSLAKHGSGARAGNSLFPVAKGNPAAINKQAQKIVDDILFDSGSLFTRGRRGRFGDTVEVVAPDGRGIVFDTIGKFLFFKE